MELYFKNYSFSIETLEKNSIPISMSGKANPYDNAKIGSFFRKLKVREVYSNK